MDYPSKLDYLLIIMIIIKVDKEEQDKNNNDNEETAEFKIVYLFLIYNLLSIVLCG
jgi:hypothetical protein